MLVELFQTRPTARRGDSKAPFAVCGSLGTSERVYRNGGLRGVRKEIFEASTRPIGNPPSCRKKGTLHQTIRC